MDVNARIALLYGTGEGHTRKIADHIATHLKEMNHRVELFDVKKLPGDFSLEGYDGAIIGASIHAGNYSRAVKKAVTDHKQWLKTSPSAFFSVSLTAAEESEEAKEQVQAYIDDFIERSDWHPVLVASFAGAMPFSRYGFMKRMLMRAAGRRLEGEGDFDTTRDYEYTDWASVDEFIEQFLSHLGLAGESSGEPRPTL